MGMMLNMVEGMVGLTDEEKAQVAPALPYVTDMLTTLNNAMPELMAANKFYVQAQPLIERLLNDLKLLLPNGIALLNDGMVDIAGSMSTVKDVENLYKQNPAYISTLQAHYNKLVPIINKMTADWPKVEPAYKIVSAAMARKKTTFGAILSDVHDSVADGSFQHLAAPHTEEVQPEEEEPDEDIVETMEDEPDVDTDEEALKQPRHPYKKKKSKR